MRRLIERKLAEMTEEDAVMKNFKKVAPLIAKGEAKKFKLSLTGSPTKRKTALGQTIYKWETKDGHFVNVSLGKKMPGWVLTVFTGKYEDGGPMFSTVGGGSRSVRLDGSPQIAKVKYSDLK
jgi:hypothetical protein